jgi:hypothetical protein
MPDVAEPAGADDNHLGAGVQERDRLLHCAVRREAGVGERGEARRCYAKVVEADGSNMTVGTALALINQALAEALNEHEGASIATRDFA